MTTIQNSQDLLSYLVHCHSSGNKNWFGYPQQRIAGVHLAYEIAKLHADKMTPEEVVDYVIKLNNVIFLKILRGD